MYRASFSPKQAKLIALRNLKLEGETYVEVGRTEFAKDGQWNVLLQYEENLMQTKEGEILMQIVTVGGSIIGEKIITSQNSNRGTVETPDGVDSDHRRDCFKLHMQSYDQQNIYILLTPYEMPHWPIRPEETMFETHYAVPSSIAGPNINITPGQRPRSRTMSNESMTDAGDHWTLRRTLSNKSLGSNKDQHHPIQEDTLVRKLQVRPRSLEDARCSSISSYLWTPQIACTIAKSFLAQMVDFVHRTNCTNTDQSTTNEMIAYLSDQYAHTTAFKPSVHKVSGPHFTPTNLCIEQVWIDGKPTLITSYGAPSAHALGYEVTSGASCDGLFRSDDLAEYRKIQSCQSVQELNTLISNSSLSRHIIIQGGQSLDDLRLECNRRLQSKSKQSIVDANSLRRDICFCNFVTAVGSALSTALDTACTTLSSDTLEAWIKNLEINGLLVMCESLLSTRGNEKRMLEDYYGVIKQCQQERMSISISQGDTAVSMGSFGDIELNIRHSKINVSHIRVTAVLFTQGVNEVQTMANALGETRIQESINDESLRVLKEWVTASNLGSAELITKLQYHIALSVSGAPSLPAMPPMFNPFPFRRHKHVEILEVAGAIARSLNQQSPVLHLISCKSGKDRTAMSATLAIATQVQDSGGIPLELLELMRSERGVRLQNVERNLLTPEKYCCGDNSLPMASSMESSERFAISCRSNFPCKYTTGGLAGRFAFNKMQIGLLPEKLRPPARVCGNVAS